MTTWVQPIHVNTGMLQAHAQRLMRLADRIDTLRSNLTSSVGLLTWNSAIPNHAAIIGSYSRAVSLMQARADALRKTARQVNRYAEVMAMIDAAFKVAPSEPGMAWRGIPGAVAERGEGPSSIEWAHLGWETFEQGVSVLGLGERATIVTTYSSMTVRGTVVTMQAGRYAGENVVLFGREPVWIQETTASTTAVRTSAPWLTAFEKISKGLALVSIPLEIKGLIWPEHQNAGAKGVERIGHASSLGAALMTFAGAAATTAGVALAGVGIGVPIGLWREDTYERWDAEGRGPINSVSDAVQVVVNPLKTADTALYGWHAGVGLAAEAYYNNVDFKVGGVQFGVEKAPEPTFDRYQHSAAVGATLRELQARYPNIHVDQTVPGQTAVTFPTGERVVIDT